MIDVPTTARAALDEIAETAPGHVYASRRGICGGVANSRDGRVIMFRRKSGRVRMEIIDQRSSSQASSEIYDLSPPLRDRAGRMLDAL